MPETQASLQHSTLNCSLRGLSSTSTIQFRNLKYATISARYQDAIPSDTLKIGSDGVYDATIFGPSCPQKRGAQAWGLTLTGDISLLCTLGQGETETMDEFECLHVNVTIPQFILNTHESHGSGLPVFVWVHGGALSMGSNSWPQYDLQRFVERSIKVGKPVIAVSINYRLGLFGFAATEALGASGNMGYKDQVLAFRWIKKHIAGFGGDPNNITAAGESAGGISLSTLLCADTGEGRLFDRVVVMSGDVTLRKPRRKNWQQGFYEVQARQLSIREGDREALKRKLIATDAEQLAQELPLAQHYCGLIDGKWLKEDIPLSTLSSNSKSTHKPTWCKEFVAGDTAHDGTVLKQRILDPPGALERLHEACSQYLTRDETITLLEAYKLHGTPSEEKRTHMLRALASELRFHLPALLAYAGWKANSRRAFRYHFHVPNSIKGMYKGLASHEFDVMLLLQNINGLLDERTRKIAEGMADHFIRYSHGEGWAQQGKIVVFGYDGIEEIEESEYDARYRGERGRVLQSIDADRLWKVAEMWQGVKSEDEEPTRAERL